MTTLCVVIGLFSGIMIALLYSLFKLLFRIEKLLKDQHDERMRFLNEALPCECHDRDP